MEEHRRPDAVRVEAQRRHNQPRDEGIARLRNVLVHKRKKKRGKKDIFFFVLFRGTQNAPVRQLFENRGQNRHDENLQYHEAYSAARSADRSAASEADKPERSLPHGRNAGGDVNRGEGYHQYFRKIACPYAVQTKIGFQGFQPAASFGKKQKI